MRSHSDFKVCSIFVGLVGCLLMMAACGSATSSTPTSAPSAPTTDPLPSATSIIAPTFTLTGNCAKPAGWIEYRVGAGEDIDAVAFKFNTTILALAANNCLFNPVLKEGDVLFVPLLTATAAPIPTQAQVTAPAPAPDLTFAPPPPTPLPATILVPSPTHTPEKLPAPGPGNPRLEVNPYAGPIGTVYTISIVEFKPGESVTVDVLLWPSGPVVFSTSTVVDSAGRGVVHFTSQPGMSVGVYIVRATGSAGSFATGQLEVNP